MGPNAVLNPKRPFVVYGTPRSGTTLVYGILGDFLIRNHGMPALNEYFNTRWHYYRKAGKIARAEFDLATFDARPESSDRSTLRKLEWLMEDPGYSLKLLPRHLPREGLDWLARGSDWIFVERTDLFEQFLSFSISTLTDSWYRDGGLNWQERSLEANPGIAEQLARDYDEYYLMKRELNPEAVLIYEEIANPVDPIAVLRRAGLPEDAKSAIMTERQNVRDKLLAFRDPDRVKRVYRESRLQELYPIA
jgi:hypothetical protein